MNTNRALALAVVLPVALLLISCASTPSASDSAAHAEAVAAEHKGDRPQPALAGDLPSAEGETFEQEVDYGAVSGLSAKGFIAWPADAEEPRPGVIVIHEWWGLNDNIRQMTRQLASEGYVALAVDLYGGGVGEDADGARALMRAAMADKPGLRANLVAAHRFLREHAQAPRVGTLGWCFGGGMSLEAALTLGGALDAAVMFYGHPEQDESRLLALQTPVLGLFAGEDRSIPVSAVEQFEATLLRLGREASIHVYPGAHHAFANPSGTRYDAQAAQDAWGKTLSFLARHLQP